MIYESAPYHINCQGVVMFIFYLFEIIVGIGGIKITEALHLFMMEQPITITEVLCHFMTQLQLGVFLSLNKGICFD